MELRQLTDNVARKRPGKQVIVSQLADHYSEDVDDKIAAMNNFISQELMRRPNWHLLSHDLDEHTEYKHDGLHLNENGSAKVALAIRKITRHLKFE